MNIVSKNFCLKVKSIDGFIFNEILLIIFLLSEELSLSKGGSMHVLLALLAIIITQSHAYAMNKAARQKIATTIRAWNSDTSLLKNSINKSNNLAWIEQKIKPCNSDSYLISNKSNKILETDTQSWYNDILGVVKTYYNNSNTSCFYINNIHENSDDDCDNNYGLKSSLLNKKIILKSDFWDYIYDITNPRNKFFILEDRNLHITFSDNVGGCVKFKYLPKFIEEISIIYSKAVVNCFIKFVDNLLEDQGHEYYFNSDYSEVVLKSCINWVKQEI